MVQSKNIFTNMDEMDTDSFINDTDIALYYDGWGWCEENIVICDECGERVSEDESIYSSRMEAYFCSTECLVEYAL